MRTGKIAIMVQDGKVISTQEMSGVIASDIGQMMAQLEIVKQDLITAYKKCCERKGEIQ